MQKPAPIVPTSSNLPQIQAEKDDSTTTSPTAVGFTKVTEVLDASQFAECRKRTTLAEKVQAEAAICEGCTGDCLKASNRRYFPEIRVEFGEENVSYRSCKYGIQRRRQHELERKFRSSRIPPRYIGKTFDDYKVDASNRNAVTFAKQALTSKIGAYLFGECGTGKTFLAALIAQEFLKDGKSVVFVKVPSLLDDIKATFNGQGRELELLDELRTANLVVLDDFGMEAPTQWAGATLCKVIDMRYDNPVGKTIITSNLSLEELARHLNQAKDGNNLNGSRIADRCREICKPILLKGTTRRN